MPLKGTDMQHRFSRVVFAGMTLGFAACNPSFAAGWELFHAAPDATLYTEPSTIIKEGRTAKMWALIDYKLPQQDKTGKQVLSDKLQYQYDCQGKTLSIIATTAYTGPMASGDIVNENPDAPQVTPIPAGTLAESLWQQACMGVGPT
jgi:hypothetical protein